MSSKLTSVAQLRQALAKALGLIGETAEAAAQAVEAVTPLARPVELTAAGWTGSGPYTQTAAVTGVLADEGAQLVQIAPAAASREAWKEAGAECIGQGNGSLTFTAQVKPAGSIRLFVILQEVGV